MQSEFQNMQKIGGRVSKYAKLVSKSAKSFVGRILGLHVSRFFRTFVAKIKNLLWRVETFQEPENEDSGRCEDKLLF